MKAAWELIFEECGPDSSLLWVVSAWAPNVLGLPKGIEQKLLVTQHGFSHLKAHPILIQSSDVWASNQAQIESNHPISSHAEQQRECAPASS